MIKKMFYALGISILVFVLSEAFNLTLIRDMYDSGQAVMAAVAEPVSYTHLTLPTILLV